MNKAITVAPSRISARPQNTAPVVRRNNGPSTYDTGSGSVRVAELAAEDPAAQPTPSYGSVSVGELAAPAAVGADSFSMDAAARRLQRLDLNGGSRHNPGDLR